MLSCRVLRSSRIPSVRPLRPPALPIAPKQPSSQPRLFTHNAHLLRSAQHTPRPQVPYLAQPAFRRPQTFLGPNQQLARLLSTENKRYFKDQLWLATKWTLIGWAFILLGGVAYFGVQVEVAQKRDPTPLEWTWTSRQRLRQARAAKNDTGGLGVVDWAQVGSNYRSVLARLEDTNGDGKGLVDVLEGGVWVDGVGKAGFDISGKSWPWRVGYCEALMGCARAAEHLDGMVLDKTRSMVFPREMMIGPSNPDPRPVPAYMHAAPLEENCTVPFDAPEVYYMRILTSKGFTTKQKLDSALAYANWLEYKGLNDSALEMYKWGVDIARDALVLPIRSLTNAGTGTLRVEDSVSGSSASANLLRAATGLAIHQARTGNVSSALPILLSVLRARRSATVSIASSANAPYTGSEETSGLGAALKTVTSLLSPSEISTPEFSGDEPLTRTSNKPTCEDSELMLYIGEILFASATTAATGSAIEGLSWTRQAVTIAEANLQSATPKESDAKSGGQKCRECLLTGVSNWELMLKQLSRKLGEAGAREGGTNAGWLEFGGWFGSGQGLKGKTMGELQAGVIEEELRQVEQLKQRIVREGIDREFRNAGAAAGSGLWIG